jgi:hypothetical protein
MRVILHIVVLCFSAVSTHAFSDETLPLTVKPEDIIPPKIEHDPSNEPTTGGKPVMISAIVTDEGSGIKEVSLFFRPKGTQQYRRLPMVSRRIESRYEAEIPSHFVQKPGIEYYIEAIDVAGNKILRGVNFSPIVIAVGSEGAAPTTASPTQEPAQTEEITSSKLNLEPETKKNNNWVWWTVGVVAAGTAIALSQSGGGGGGGGGGTEEETGTVSITAPALGEP